MKAYPKAEDFPVICGLGIRLWEMGKGQIPNLQANPQMRIALVRKLMDEAMNAGLMEQTIKEVEAWYALGLDGGDLADYLNDMALAGPNADETRKNPQ